MVLHAEGARAADEVVRPGAEADILPGVSGELEGYPPRHGGDPVTGGFIAGARVILTGDGGTRKQEGFIDLKKLALERLLNPLGMPDPSDLIEKWVA